MTGLWRHPIALALLALVLMIVAAATFTIVPETEQVVVLQFGRPVDVWNGYDRGQSFGDDGAGLRAKIPYFQNLRVVDKRILDVDAEDAQVISADQQRLQVDAFARFRVIDPLRMVIRAGTEENTISALTPLLGSAIRDELGKRPFQVLLSPQRDVVMEAIQRRMQINAAQYGVQIVDVRIKHADLPGGSPLDSAFARMKAARQQQATTIRANGRRDAQIVQAQADAQAAQIYAQAFNQDPEFYDFYRAMQSYQRTFGPAAPGQAKPPTTVILSPENGYLKQFENRGK